MVNSFDVTKWYYNTLNIVVVIFSITTIQLRSAVENLVNEVFYQDYDPIGRSVGGQQVK